MAHELESTPRAVYTGRPAWHKLGIVVSERLPIGEYLARANMSYTVEAVPAFAPSVVVGSDGIARMVVGEQTRVPGQFFLQRNGIGGDGAIVSPKTVSARYGIVSPLMLASPLAPFVEQGFATWDSALTLRGGQTEIVSARLDDIRIPVSGDESDAEIYLVGRNRHGAGTADYVVCRNRTVCANTERIAFSGGADLSFRHDLSIEDRIAQAAALWSSAHDAIRTHAAALSRLGTTPCSVPDTVDALLGIKGVPASDVPTRKANERDAIIAAATNSPGTNGATLLDVYNAVSYLATHDAGGKGGDDDATRLASLLDGVRGERIERTLATLLTLAP
jgi:hypothetical protein